MGKKCNCPSPGPNMSYMISFGDTMTALLAFFIVLNSMAENQTGANLHAGTGSFVSSTSSFGLPGSFLHGRSKQIFQQAHSPPHYVVPPIDVEADHAGNDGPDDDPDHQRILNWQKEQFQNFLNEMDRTTPVRQESDIDGEQHFDVLGSLPQEGPMLNEDRTEAIKELAGMLRRPGAEIELTVWCTVPSEEAWTRAIRQASQLRKETIQLLQLPPDQQIKLTAIARPWRWEGMKLDKEKYPKEQYPQLDTIVKRPGMSINVRVTKPPTGP